MRYRHVSADSHVNEPPDLWETRLGVGLRDRGPRCIDLPNGGQGFVMEDLEEDPVQTKTTVWPPQWTT
jgi:hypothetical protein